MQFPNASAVPANMLYPGDGTAFAVSLVAAIVAALA
jgi:hypothetical protein